VKRVAILALACSIAAIGGCATGANMNLGRDMMLYGGTRLDASIVTVTVEEELGLGQEIDGREVHNEYASPLLASLAVVDFPLAIVADTLTLPITSAVTLVRWSRNKPEQNRVNEEKPDSPGLQSDDLKAVEQQR